MIKSSTYLSHVNLSVLLAPDLLAGSIQRMYFMETDELLQKRNGNLSVSLACHRWSIFDHTAFYSAFTLHYVQSILASVSVPQSEPDLRIKSGGPLIEEKIESQVACPKATAEFDCAFFHAALELLEINSAKLNRHGG